MNEVIAKFAKDAILRRIGVTVRAGLTDENPPSLAIVPSDGHPNESFTVIFTPGWRSAEASFVPGKFAAPLLAQMGEASEEAKSAVAAFAAALDSRKTRVTLRVNGMDVSPLDLTGWPKNWTRMELQARCAPQVINPDDFAQMREIVSDLVIPVFGMAAALIGVEEATATVAGEAEGTPYQTLVTRYERKKVNREACIQLKGLACHACGFDFAAFYGDVGCGYVEIHHTTPVSELGPNYVIDVAKDLVPLCANCHAMVHRQNPPMPIEELKELIIQRRGA